MNFPDETISKRCAGCCRVFFSSSNFKYQENEFVIDVTKCYQAPHLILKKYRSYGGTTASAGY